MTKLQGGCLQDPLGVPTLANPALCHQVSLQSDCSTPDKLSGADAVHVTPLSSH